MQCYYFSWWCESTDVVLIGVGPRKSRVRMAQSTGVVHIDRVVVKILRFSEVKFVLLKC